jgi:guanylate kinase
MVGKLIILSAPSGSGKSTIIRRLLQHFPNLSFSISATSRKARQGEEEGIHYYFMSPEEFKEDIQNEAFLEWEEVYPDHFYGTLRSEVVRIWDSGKQVAFDIDVQGGLNLKKQFERRALALFIQPPSIEVLEERLTNRGTESEDKIQMRVDKAREELLLADQFDQIIINDDLEEAVAQAISVCKAFIE